MSFHFHNPSPQQAPLTDSFPQSFTLRTPPDRDIWRKPPSTNRFDAPFLTRSLSLSSLRSARVTISADWQTLFDQGGLILILPGEPGQDRSNRRWIKTGIEVFDGKPNISTVACDRWADWSLAPLSTQSGGEVTIEVTREVRNTEKTSTLWVHSVDVSTGEKKALREIAWVFEKTSLEGHAECEIGVYVAKPVKDQSNEDAELEVKFKDLGIEEW